MSLYHVNIHGNEYKVNISANQATVNGEPIRTRLQALNGEGLHQLRRGRQALELLLSIQDSETYQMVVGGQRFVTRVTQNPKRMRQNVQGQDCGAITAPMHGLIIDIPVKIGDEVEVGQTVAVLESMKMQMQIRTPQAGKVIGISAVPGAQVDKGILLVQISEEAERG